MKGIIKQSARALLFDSEQRLVLIKRTKPQQEPYWVTVGGGVETDDVSVEAALHREIREEIGGRIGLPCHWRERTPEHVEDPRRV